MKTYPTYVTSRFQSTFYLLLGIVGGGWHLLWFMNSGNPWGMIGFIGLVGMATRVMVKRRNWKIQCRKA